MENGYIAGDGRFENRSVVLGAGVCRAIEIANIVLDEAFRRAATSITVEEKKNCFGSILRQRISDSLIVETAGAGRAVERALRFYDAANRAEAVVVAAG